jgi:pyruvate dehydrogenase E1 component alpha subunit
MSDPQAKLQQPDHRQLLQTMLQIRRFEEKASQQYGLRKIGGFLHLYIGEEAVATGAIAAADLKRDYVVAAYRDHGHALAVGMDPKTLMAELFAKAVGCSRGKGGSMHFFDADRHFLGGNGIVGAQLPVATGVGLKIKYQEEDGVVLCFFGDGAIHQGAFHESLNLARLWNLPVVYICENNQYGMGTDFHRVSSATDFSAMAGSYDMPGSQVDGMDVLAVHQAVSEAIDLARAQGMPSLLEVKTYRYVGHSISDPATYRSKEELQQHKEQDPILILKKRMQAEKALSEEDYNQMDAAAKAAAVEAVAFAENAPEPELSSLYEHVLA